MNFQDWNYDPFKFNIKSVETVLVRLEGKLLRISKPEQVMLSKFLDNFSKLFL
jgi:hypothetical protein